MRTSDSAPLEPVLAASAELPASRATAVPLRTRPELRRKVRRAAEGDRLPRSRKDILVLLWVRAHWMNGLGAAFHVRSTQFGRDRATLSGRTRKPVGAFDRGIPVGADPQAVPLALGEQL